MNCYSIKNDTDGLTAFDVEWIDAGILDISHINIKVASLL